MTIVLLFQLINTLCGIQYAKIYTHYIKFRFIPYRQFCLPKLAH